MASWIAPSLAADYLNVSEDEIHRQIHSGELPVRHDGGFLFVNIHRDTPVVTGTVANLTVTEETLPVPDRIWSIARQEAGTRRLKPRKAA